MRLHHLHNLHKSCFPVTVNKLDCEGGEGFFTIRVWQERSELRVQPGLTGSWGVCDELAAYLRARGNKHGVAGRD